MNSWSMNAIPNKKKHTLAHIKDASRTSNKWTGKIYEECDTQKNATVKLLAKFKCYNYDTWVMIAQCLKSAGFQCHSFGYLSSIWFPNKSDYDYLKVWETVEPDRRIYRIKYIYALLTAQLGPMMTMKLYGE